MEKLVNLCKQYGFIFQGSEIYDGLANTWDFGPLGAELKSNVKKAWLKKFVQEDPNNVGLDSAILMNPKTWEASGHLATFSDPLIDCKACKSRHRADKLVEDDGVIDAGGNTHCAARAPSSVRHGGHECPYEPGRTWKRALPCAWHGRSDSAPPDTSR